MFIIRVRKHCLALLLLLGITAAAALAQSTQRSNAPTHANLLRGEYGRYRANNDLLFYHLDIRIDPEKKYVSGKNTIRFRMLKDDTRIQLDLYDNLKIDKIDQMFAGQDSRGRPTKLRSIALKYERDSGAVFVDFPETLKADRVYTIEFYYSGTPQTIGRFGGFTFGKDPAGRHWIFTACEGEGASIWWPNKDQWKDEVESMKISVAVPNGMTDVSNGRFIGKTDLGDGFTRWDWLVNYPINNYNVSVNIGKYEHWSDRLNDLSLDFYALPEDLERARKQFAQARGMLQAFQHYFGEYPFKKDGYKLIQAPYSGMEHQSAVTYGNRFANGYLERDWTGVGISPRFDFIIIHESGHEWFGNSVTAADRSDMWIHEGWTTYLECLYVEFMYGKADGLKYTNGYRAKVGNQRPIIAPRGVNATPPQDQYFKGALFLNTLRSVVDDDRRWFILIRNLYQRFKYQSIMTEDMIAYFNRSTRRNLTPIFNQYLRHTAIPKLELKFDEKAGTVSYRWKVDEPGFAMPVRVGTKDRWQIIQPTTEWQTMKTSLRKDAFEVATDLYFVDVSKS
ncbi:MAG: M1 family metallopeptidase [Pyrinomonadaceae bacterium]